MTEEIVKSALSKVLYPGFTKDIVTFGFVKDIVIKGSDVSFTVDITSSAPEVAKQIKDEATARILFSDISCRMLGWTTTDKIIEVHEVDSKHGSRRVFAESTDVLKKSWQVPMKGIF